MTFQKGTSGNPKGRPKRGAALSEFLRAELEKPWRPGERLTNKERIAQVIVKQAAGGNLRAVAWLTDRMEGTAPQRIEHSGPGGGPMQQEHTGAVEIQAVDYRHSIRALTPPEDREALTG
jgi:hypothetical protein